MRLSYSCAKPEIAQLNQVIHPHLPRSTFVAPVALRAGRFCSPCGFAFAPALPPGLLTQTRGAFVGAGFSWGFMLPSSTELDLGRSTSRCTSLLIPACGKQSGGYRTPRRVVTFEVEKGVTPPPSLELTRVGTRRFRPSRLWGAGELIALDGCRPGRLPWIPILDLARPC